MEKKKIQRWNKDIKLKWLDFNFIVGNSLLTKVIIEKALKNFFKERVLLDNFKIFIIFKIRIEDGPIRNISTMQLCNHFGFDELLETFYLYWDLKSQEYEQYVISKIIFAYAIIPNDIDFKFNDSKLNLKLNKNKNKNNSVLLKNGLLDTINFGGFNLPSTMDFTLWGDCCFNDDYTHAIVYKNKNNKNIFYDIKINDKNIEVELKNNNKVLLSFEDCLLDNTNLGSFTRKVKKFRYKFIDCKLIQKKKLYKCKYIKPLDPETFYKDNFLTMDLETRIVNGKMEVYHISIYDGKSFYTFYLNDYSNTEELIKDSLLSLMKRKYHRYKIYLHNFSNFDSIYLLNVMISLSNKIQPIMRDNVILNMKVYFGEKNMYYLEFRDSLLLLPGSLKNLSKEFGVEEKLNFPYEFVNHVDLAYKGEIPSIKYFNKLKKKDYLDYCKLFKDKEWDLKKETIKYCNQDVKSLYDILSKFSSQTFNLFRVNIINYPTLASLTLAVFRTIFLKGNKIPILTGELYDFIKKAYTGGAVDVFKPYGKDVFVYDINSLYPYIMKIFDMPVGDPYLLEGEFDESDIDINNQMGFVEVDVEAPKDLNIPFLQVRLKTKNGGQHTITPLGKWRAIYTDKEIRKAKELGYKFTKYHRALIFETKNLFENYVDFWYEIKNKYDKDSFLYKIAKLFLNGLSGRFGLSPVLEKHQIIDNSLFLEFAEKYTVTNVTPLKNDKLLISYFEDESYYNKSPNVDIAISAYITALARIFMYQFKDENLLYTDTDSIHTNVLMNDKLVGNEIGKFKLEYIFKEAIYLGPKIYMGKTNQNKEVSVIKGSKESPDFDTFKELRIKNNSLKIEQEKWIKDVAQGNISIRSSIYTLMVTDNKRRLIYNGNNELIDTKPIIIDNDEIID